MSDKKYSVNFATANGNPLRGWRALRARAVGGFHLPSPVNVATDRPSIAQIVRARTRHRRAKMIATRARASPRSTYLRVCYPDHVAVDFDEFEQLVLKVLFETDVPVTAAHVAYLGRISVRTAERHLARMVEQGTLNVRTNAAGIVEYVYPGPQAAGDARRATTWRRVGPPPITVRTTASS